MVQTQELLLLDKLAEWVTAIAPDFLNVGADSKGNGLTEPTFAKILEFVEALRVRGIEVRKKHNMERLEKKHNEAVQAG